MFILRKEGQLWARFEIDATNTREAYADLVSEGADIALVTAAPTTAEAQMAQSAGSGDLLTGERSILLGFDRRDRAEIEPDLDTSCGIKPGEGDFDIQAGESQSAATISLYTPARRLPKTGRDFLKFAASRRARDVIDEAGLHAPAIVERPFSELGDRLAYAVSRIGTGYALEDVQRVTDNLTGKTRLSSTFRFMTGARALDMRSRGEIGRLSDEISDGDFNGRVITLAGFSSDDPRGFARSKSDAERVLRELRSHADYPDLEFAIQPFGNVFPVLCDGSDRAAHLNRRVEIWVE